MEKKISVAVFALWRNSEKHIHRTLAQLDNILLLSNQIDFSFFFYENDSEDNTVKILQEWLVGKNGELLSETLGTKQYGSIMNADRMKLLASYRNKCKKMAEGQNFDFALVLDSDVIFNSNNLAHAHNFLVSNRDYVMATPNVRQNIKDFISDASEDSYYDVGCLRDKYGNETLYSSNCPLKRLEDRNLWNLNKPVEINAGFGGFALIRWGPFSQVEWSADINIEHVNFCYDLKKYGKIAILPYSKVFVFLNLPPDYMSSIEDNLRRQLYEV